MFTSALCLVGTVFIPSGVSALLVSGGELGGFDLDGNQDVADSVLDWANATGVVKIIDDFGDSGFHTGSKEAEPSKWDCAPLNHPGKDDILRAYVSQHTDAGGLYLNVAWVRADTSGDGSAHLNFEFNKAAQATPPANGDCPLVRQAGDLLLTYDFGGAATAQPDIRAFTWDPTLIPGNDEGTWVERTLTAAMAKGAVNAGFTATDYLAGDTPVALEDRRFGEATVDLGALLAAISPNTCVGYTTTHVRSRSSGSSIDSALQDKLAPTPVNISNCGRIQIEKRTDGGALLPGADFQVLASNQTTVLGTCTTDSLGVCTVSNLVPGANYYVRETAAPTGYTAASGILGPFTVTPGGTTSVGPVVNIRSRYALTLTPAEDTNLVDNDHVFLATLTRSTNGGSTYLPASGHQIDFGLAGIGSILGAVPSGPNAGSCLTTAAGTCTVTIRSSAPGDSTLAATYDDQVVSTGVEATASAVKHWHNYRIDVTPSGHSNEVGKSHTFTVTLERATNGDNWAAVAGVNPVITDVSGPGTITGGTCGTTGTDAAGQCTVVLSSATAGTDTIEASYHAVVSDTSKTFTKSAVKNWVDYALVVNPDGVHRAGESHTFTAVLTRNTGSGPAPFAGQIVNLAWNGTNGSSLTGPSCLTAADGTCSIVANSALPANGEVTATWGATLDSGAVTRSDKAIARWVDWTLTVGPATATNLVGTNHTFRITVTQDSGLGGGPLPVVGAHPVAVVTGAGSVVSNGCATSGTNAAGVCTVVITSAAPGSSHLAVSYQGVDGNATETVSGAADKLWVSYAITVVDDGVARAGTEQSYTVTVTTDDGPGDPEVVPNVVVALSWNGPAGSGIVSATPAGPGAGFCTTNGSGQCTVVVNSPDPAEGELTGTYSFVVDSGPGSVSDSAGKRWVDWAMTLTPAEAENLTDTDHTFIVTLTGDSGEGDGVRPIEGANPVFTLQGEGEIVSDGCDTDGTDADGRCEVVVHSDNPGDSFASVSWTGEDAGATGTVSGTAFKHWVTYRLNVTPETSTGPVGTTHQWLVHLEVDRGEGFENAGSEDIDLAVTGVGSVTGVDAGNATSCVTDTAGTCRVTVSSPTPGNTTLVGTYHAVAGPTSRDLTDSGLRTWTDIPVTPVEPDADPVILGSNKEKPVPVTPVQPAAPVIPIVAAPIPEQPVVSAPPQVQATLPVTGAATAGAMRVALGLLAAGLALIAAGRRRPQSAS